MAISPDGAAILVRNLEAAQRWYCEKFGCMRVQQEQFGTDEAALAFDPENVAFSVTTDPEKATDGVPLFDSTDIESDRQELEAKGVLVSSISTDGAGARFFTFTDPEGNKIEVCQTAGGFSRNVQLGIFLLGIAVLAAWWWLTRK